MNYAQDIQISCYGARKLSIQQAKHCPFVDWLSASVWNTTSSTIDSVMDSLKQYNLDQQDALVEKLNSFLFSNVQNSISHSSYCSNALRQLSCLVYFPQCEQVGLSLASIEPYPTCALMCSIAEAACGGSSLGCSKFSNSNRGQCSVFVAPGTFILPPELVRLICCCVYYDGPYNNIPSLYYTLISLWSLVCTAWMALLCMRADRIPNSDCHHYFFSGILVLKLLVLLLATVFWSDCAASGGVCRSLLGLAITSCQLIFETGLMAFLLLLSKGWMLTRPVLPQHEWRNAILSAALFYLVVSILSGMRPQPISSSWLLAFCIVYAVYYLRILYNSLHQLSRLYSHLKLLKDGMLPEAVQSIHLKASLYMLFLLCELIALVIEVACRALHSLNYLPGDNSRAYRFSTSGGHTGTSTWIILLLYEVSNVVILATMAFCLRPRELSPFYYMVPLEELHAWGEEDEAINDSHPNLLSVPRGPPIVELLMEEPDGANLTCELELTPLLDRELLTTTAAAAAAAAARPAAVTSKMLAVLHAPFPQSQSDLTSPPASSQLRLGIKEPPRRVEGSGHAHRGNSRNSGFNYAALGFRSRNQRVAPVTGDLT